MRWLFGKIRNKLIFLFLFIASIPLILGYLSLHFTQESIREQIFSSRASLRKVIAKNVEEYIINCEKVIIEASVQFEIIDAMRKKNAKKLDKRFSQIYKRHKNYIFIFAEDTKGNILSSFPKNLRNSSYRKYYKTAIKFRQPLLTNTFLSPTGRWPATVVIASPVFYKKNILGLIVGGIDLKKLSMMLEKLKPGKGGNICIVDRKGICLANTDRKKILENFSGDYLVKKSLDGEEDVLARRKDEGSGPSAGRRLGDDDSDDTWDGGAVGPFDEVDS